MSPMACVLGLSAWAHARPLRVMSIGILLKLVVPILALIAGHNDPNENAISHVFGQTSVCVAMDFPGWFEAAATFFIVTGIMESWAAVQVYWHCKASWEEAGARKSSLAMLRVLFGFIVVCLNSFWMVSVWNPVSSHAVDTIIAHTIPYLVLQAGYCALVLFLVATLRPACVSKCHKVSWYFVLSVYFFAQITNLCLIFWTFAELLGGIESVSADSEYRGPKVRNSFTRPLESMKIGFLMLVLCVHPLCVHKSAEEKVEKVEKVDKVAEIA